MGDQPSKQTPQQIHTNNVGASLFGVARRRDPLPNDVIHKLNETLLTLEKRMQFLETRCAENKAAAENHLKSGNKRSATTCLKRKKICEKQLENLSGAYSAMEQDVFAIEGATLQNETFNGLKLGAQTLASLNNSINPDVVGDVMDDAREQIDIADEIASMMCQLHTPVEMSDVESELAELEEQIALTRHLGVDVPNSVPVPGNANNSDTTTTIVLKTPTPPQTTEKENRELELLAVDMAM